MGMSNRSHPQDQMGLKAIELRMLFLIFQKKKIRLHKNSGLDKAETCQCFQTADTYLAKSTGKGV